MTVDVRLRLAAGRAVAAERMPYLRVALFAMTPALTTAVPTSAVDAGWRMYANPAFVATLSVDEAAAVWLHEAGHLLHDHAARWAALAEPAERHPLWNAAGDAVINESLRQAGFELPVRGVHWEDVPGAEPGMLTEQLYRLLSRGSTPDPDDCGSGAGGPPRPWEEPGGGVDDGRAVLIRRRVAEDIRAAGDAPAALRRFADETLSPRVDWRRELRSVVRRSRATVAGASDYTFGRVARRAAATPGIVLPALRAPRTFRLDLVVDTSGSMSAARLGRALAELRGITGALRGVAVRVICCDAGAGPPRRVRSVGDVVLTGGGGTDMRVGIAAAAGSRPRADLVVIATDGDTPWPGGPPPANPRARYVALLVDGPRPGVPEWMHEIVIDGAR
ncbi:vWA domain-containing protein [Actinoplanes flavus]|uniref:Metallopeptidase domain-containing protein n=1 Tax=Actinoplanes flavus TaxID=2820290 RepID=A0ABS3UGT2_9ACTN|nr:VWA-like domain-containing protein [Actinoplanes flavus]MBO3737976.1 hypothetical protein [Actinoplanes flavus]